MKIRNGFVSNSSSSSFCVFYGTSMDRDELAELFNVSLLENDTDIIIENIENKLNDKFKNTNITFDVDVNKGDGVFYIGRSYNTIKDTETGKQFKDSVKLNLQEILNTKIKCKYIEEVIYDY